MWHFRIMGIELYEILLWFLVYSMLGWLVESIYMSICNRKITNRGFARGPFCPIYGVGALIGFFLLRGYTDNKFILFLMGSFVATSVELITAIIMKRIFGEVWWDYTEKPFNFKGIICLESSIAWGFYTLIFFSFLQGFVDRMVGNVPLRTGKMVICLLLLFLFLDSAHSFYIEKKDYVQPKISNLRERLRNRFFDEE